ncbi:MAG: hypothetical protein JJV95_03895 [Sulfurospirillum sp.]|nr:hypothetical protein [Sulfurospirillum sp.]
MTVYIEDVNDENSSKYVLYLTLKNDTNYSFRCQDSDPYECLVPLSYGISYNSLKGVNLCQLFYTHVPRQRQKSEKRYLTLKRV